jgi:hypothetical protein
MDGLVGWLLAKEDERQFGIFYDQTIWEKKPRDRMIDAHKIA